MDDILAKKNRHLFLEEKDNVGNSFIANINKVAESTDIWLALKDHEDEIAVVSENIDNVNTVAENIDDVNTVADNMDDVNNVSNALDSNLLESWLEQLNASGNDYLLRISALGNRILTSRTAFNYAAVVTIQNDIAANATITLPDAMAYYVGSHMLLLSWNGTVCYRGEQYNEIGETDTWSTTITTLVPLKAGDKLEFRTVAVIPSDTQVIASGTSTPRSLANRFADIVNVKDYGAIGDGTANDTTAFQNAIATGKAVFVPEGNYKLTTDLTGDFCSTGNSIFIGGTVNNSTILRGTAQRNSDIINVRDFGAKGDGLTNDTNAIQNALNAAKVSNKSVIFPFGSYCITQLIIENGVNVIDFLNSEIIKISATGPAFIADDCKNLTLQNLNFHDKDGNQRDSALMARRVEWFRLHNVKLVNNSPTDPDGISGSWAVTISGENIFIDGIYINDEIGGAWFDGIHFGRVRNLTMTNFVIFSGDDSLAFLPHDTDEIGTGTGPDVNQPSENIIVGNGILCSGKNAISFGQMEPTDGYDSIPNAVIRNARFHDIYMANETMKWVRFRDIRSVADITQKHGAIYFENITGKKGANPSSTPCIVFMQPELDGGNLIPEGDYDPEDYQLIDDIYFTNCDFTRTSDAPNNYLCYVRCVDKLVFTSCKFADELEDENGTQSLFDLLHIKNVIFKDCVFNVKTTSSVCTMSGCEIIQIDGNIAVSSNNASSMFSIVPTSANFSIFATNNMLDGFSKGFYIRGYTGNVAKIFLSGNTYSSVTAPTDIANTIVPIQYINNFDGITQNISIQKSYPRIILKNTDSSQTVSFNFNSAGSVSLYSDTNNKTLFASDVADGSLYPGANGSYALGKTSATWGNVYTKNLNVEGTYPRAFWKNTSADKEFSINLTLDGRVVFYDDSNSKTMCSILEATYDFRPGIDDYSNLGAASLQWKNAYVASGVISTSDARQKQDISNIQDGVFRAWGRVRFVVFRFINAVRKKNSKARLHIGVIAQEVQEVFQAEGLDATHYGLFCYDSWEAEKDESGDVIREAGDKYGIRYEEALALECAYQRWLGEQRDAKIEALMQRISALENNQ